MASFNFAIFGSGCEELMLSYSWGLQEIGHRASHSYDCMEQNAVNLVLIAQGLQWAGVKDSAPRLINFNVEQIGGERYQDAPLGPRYFSIMRKLPNWDYSRGNIAALGTCGITDVQHVPLGFAPTLERVSHGHKDIDVLFYGSLNARRQALIGKLRASGLRVVCSFDSPTMRWSAPERDALIARAKVVLNLGFFDQIHVLEEVRISYLLNNRAAVVSEMRPDTFAEEDMRQCVVGASMEQLPDLCRRLCLDDAERARVAERGYEAFKARPWLPALTAAVDHYFVNNPKAPSRAAKRDTPPPRHINIGSGKRWRYDCLNLDAAPTYGADLVVDLDQPLPFDRTLHSWRFGDMKLGKERFQHIRAEHVLEYAQQPLVCMRNFLDLLCEGGVLELVVPHDLSFARSRDPRILRGFNEHSWRIYGDNCWELGWLDHRFDIADLIFVLGDHGARLSGQGLSVEEIALHPRGVETLHVKLRKRAQSADERTAAGQPLRPVH